MAESHKAGPDCILCGIIDFFSGEKCVHESWANKFNPLLIGC